MAPMITSKWMANSLSPSGVTEPLLELGNKQAKALACVCTMALDRYFCGVL